jgi:hypothetical protein
MIINEDIDKFIVEIPKVDQLPFLDVNLNSNLVKSSLGIYFIFNKDKKLIYIGKSSNVRNRINMHRNGFGTGFFQLTPQINPNELFFIKVLYLNDSSFVSFLENFYISFYKPTRNFNRYYEEFSNRDMQFGSEELRELIEDKE